MKIIIKNVRKIAADGSMIKKDHVVPSSTQPPIYVEGNFCTNLSDIMTMPEKQLNLVLPKLPSKKRWFSLYRRMLTMANPAATTTHHQVHIKITNDIPISKRKYGSDDDDNKDDKDRAKRLKKGVPSSTNIGPKLPEEYKQIILGRLNGKELTLLIEKSLNPSDMKCNKSILSLPRDETLRKNILEPNEIENLERDSTLTLPLLDQKCLEWWKMSKEESYVPKTNWNEIVEQNRLVVGDQVQVWSFRANMDQKKDHLHLALVLVKRGENQNDAGKNCGQETDSISAASTVSNDCDRGL